MVLITGGSSGLGEAMGRSCLRAGYRVALAARRTERLEAIQAELLAADPAAADRLLIQTVDLRSAEAIRCMVEDAIQYFGRVDVLVANAGICYTEGVADLTEEHLLQQVEVNALAVVRCCQAVLPGMLARGSGHVLTVASVAAEVSPPDAVIYAATKGFVVSFTEGLRREVEPRGIRVTTVIPGFIRTEMTARHAMEMPPASRMGDLLVRLLHRPRRRAVYPRWYGAGIWLQRLSPRLTDLLMDLARRRLSGS